MILHKNPFDEKKYLHTLNFTFDNPLVNITDATTTTTEDPTEDVEVPTVVSAEAKGQTKTQTTTNFPCRKTIIRSLVLFV